MATQVAATKARVPHLRALAEVGCTTLPLALLLFLVPPTAPAQQSLYAQSIQTALTRTTPDLELLLLDLRTHETLANTFRNPTQPIPVGSLFKPFIAASYTGKPLTIICHGTPDRCWKPTGHGSISLTQAIAQSCNAYFLSLARTLASTPIPYLPPPPNTTPETLIGLNPTWRVTPQQLADAYTQLLTSNHPAILNGMRDSALHGTAARIGPHPGGVLAKTGTAPCIDQPCKATGDGLVIAAFPANHPTLLLLVRKRATNGATTAAAANPVLTQLESLHAE